MDYVGRRGEYRLETSEPAAHQRGCRIRRAAVLRRVEENAQRSPREQVRSWPVDQVAEGVERAVEQDTRQRRPRSYFAETQNVAKIEKIVREFSPLRPT